MTITPLRSVTSHNPVGQSKPAHPACFIFLSLLTKTDAGIVRGIHLAANQAEREEAADDSESELRTCASAANFSGLKQHPQISVASSGNAWAGSISPEPKAQPQCARQCTE